MERHLAGVRASHGGLTGMLAGGGRGSSTRWRRACCRDGTVGHVLTHLARNADSMVLVLDATERGEVVERFPGGMPTRNADIDAGAARPAHEQVADMVGDDRAAGGSLVSPHAVGDRVDGELDGREVSRRQPRVRPLAGGRGAPGRPRTRVRTRGLAG